VTGHVIIVDDDVTNLNMAGHVLSKNKFHVTALKSGKALLSHIKEHDADLILLDIIMPDVDGYETLKRLREYEKEQGKEETPVIFLTANDDESSEEKGLELGAIDFIRKPFVPEVLALRVKHIMDLIKLQRDLESEVELKTEENDRLFRHVIRTLADAIDAKDNYTKGHSGRVAEYSKAIAKRYGYTEKQQKEIFMMGILHDVGKIGIPDAVINKPAKLTPEEYDIIKNHSVMGASILSNITEMPSLVTGARWHHERIDGAGYPDGLKDADIPEAARIIAVADAYDAMTSRRSYRDILPQDKVREELVNGRGSQFDPVFADIMLKMMDEDTNYNLREKVDEGAEGKQ